jgi:hypothetical protein
MGREGAIGNLGTDSKGEGSSNLQYGSYLTDLDFGEC